MIATLTVMQFWNHAQPALLYLVPSVLVSLWGTALCRGELGFMSAFSDINDDSDDETTSNSKDSGNENAKPEDKRGLFARIWSGDVKAPFEKTESSKDDDLQKKQKETPSSTTKTESDEEKDVQNASSKEEPKKKKDGASDRHIFSLSISLP
jgi:minor histocompatibility antigen H13